MGNTLAGIPARKISNEKTSAYINERRISLDPEFAVQLVSKEPRRMVSCYDGREVINPVVMQQGADAAYVREGKFESSSISCIWAGEIPETVRNGSIGDCKHGCP